MTEIIIHCPEMDKLATALTTLSAAITEQTKVQKWESEAWAGAVPANAMETPAQIPAPPPAVPVNTQLPAAPVPQVYQPPVTPPPTAAPVAPPPAYTIDQLTTAAGLLIDKGPQAFQQLQGLLAKYNVKKVSDLPPEQYGAFATDLRGLGAQI